MTELKVKLSEQWKSFLGSHHRFARFWEVTLDLFEHGAIVVVLLTIVKGVSLYASVLFHADQVTIDMIHDREWWALWILLLYLFIVLFVTIVKRDYRTIFDSSSMNVYVAV